MVALFAVGVVTGTILSFEMGLLWPNFTATFGERLRARLRDRGLLVLPRGDLHRHLRLRLGPPLAAAALPERDPDRAHRLHRLVDGDRRQRLDEPPERLHAARRQGRRRPPVAGAVRQHLLLARADPHVPRRLHGHRLRRRRRRTRSAAARPLGTLRADRARDPADGRGARVAGAGARRRLGRRATSRPRSRRSSPRSRGSPRRRAARRSTSLGWYTANGQVEYGIEIPHLLSLLAFHSSNATVQGLDAVPGATGRRSTSSASPSRRWSGSARCSRCSASSTSSPGCGGGACPSRRGSTGSLVAAGPLSVVALIAGWVMTEVGRQPWVVYRVMRTSQAVTGASGIPVGYATLALCYLASRVGLAWVLLRLARRPLDLPASRSPGWSRSRRCCYGASARLRAGRARALRGARRRRLRRRLLAAVRRQRRPRRAHSRRSAPRDGAGLGGEPRLADLRRSPSSGPPTRGVRLDRLDARDAALHRRHRDHLPRRRLRAARREPSPRASRAGSTRSSRSPRS